MKWFQGDVGEAIVKAKKEGSIFVVVLHGSKDEDEQSERCLSILDDSKGILDKYFESAVAIRVEKGTNTFNQFAQFYPALVVPSIHLIDSQTGKEVEIISDMEEEKILQSFEKNIKLKTKTLPLQGGEVNPSDIVSPRAARVEEAQQVLQQASSRSEESTSDGASAALNLEERVERAKKLLEEKKVQKQKEDGEKVKNSEIERRELGKQMQEFKRQREDDELRKAAEERKKDKREGQWARERVRAQIAQDRIERARKFDLQKQELEQKKREEEAQKAKEQQRLAQELAAMNSSVGRIQFRLPDGSSHMNQFSADTMLSDIYTYVGQEMELPFKNFSLSTTFPRRQLDAGDKSQSLRQLCLVPTGTIFILPATSQIARPTGDIMSFFWLLMSPVTLAYSFVTGLFQSVFGGIAGGSGPSNNENTNAQSSSGTSNQNHNDSSKPRSAGINSRGIRKAGNLASLRADEDGDDDNNTWNGNSTQQM